MNYFYFSIFFIVTTVISAQQIDYNTDKGAIASGYDVVSYFKGDAIEGDKKYSTTHDTAQYRFSSQENLNTFKKNPEKYIPQYGGYCAYAIGVNSEKVSIDPETYEIRDGKLYLFYNSWGVNTLKKWKKEGAEKLAVQADVNWRQIKTKK